MEKINTKSSATKNGFAVFYDKLTIFTIKGQTIQRQQTIYQCSSTCQEIHTLTACWDNQKRFQFRM